MKNIKKNIQRGTARLADGAKLFDPADGSHVKRTTALEGKMRQINAPSELRIIATPRGLHQS